MILLFFNSPLFSQQILRGIITGRGGTPLAGATVFNKSNNKGSVSDTTGHFTISADSGAMIEISSIGYLNQQIAVTNQHELHITLSESTVNLDEVIVIGYGTAKKKDLTGAVGSVSEKDFNKGNFTSPDLLIQGKVSGVQIIS